MTAVAPDSAWQLHPQVSVRPEPFGALLYHFGTRKLSFLKDRTLLAVVQGLPEAASARVRRAIETRAIEIAPLAYMRGRTLHDAFVILDEAQNATTLQMKMFLTRLGLNSKAVITGDKTQIDLPRREDTRAHFESLFHPFGRDLPEYRRSRLLRHYAIRRQRNRGGCAQPVISRRGQRRRLRIDLDHGGAPRPGDGG